MTRAAPNAESIALSIGPVLYHTSLTIPDAIRLTYGADFEISEQLEVEVEVWIEGDYFQSPEDIWYSWEEWTDECHT